MKKKEQAKGKGKGRDSNQTFVVQGYYGYSGWQDIYTATDEDDAHARLKEYNDEERFVAHRVVTHSRRD